MVGGSFRLPRQQTHPTPANPFNACGLRPVGLTQPACPRPPVLWPACSFASLVFLMEPIYNGADEEQVCASPHPPCFVLERARLPLLHACMCVSRCCALLAELSCRCLQRPVLLLTPCGPQVVSRAHRMGAKQPVQVGTAGRIQRRPVRCSSMAERRARLCLQRQLNAYTVAVSAVRRIPVHLHYTFLPSFTGGNSGHAWHRGRAHACGTAAGGPPPLN